MSTKITAAMFVLASTCGDSAPPASTPAPTNAYSCADAFDTGCRYEAHVEIDGGTMVSAGEYWGLDYAGSNMSLEDVEATVTVTDRQGVLPPVVCEYSFDLQFDSEVEHDVTGNNASISSVDVRYNAVANLGCPIPSEWWMPPAGTFNNRDLVSMDVLSHDQPMVWTLELFHGSQESVWFRSQNAAAQTITLMRGFETEGPVALEYSQWFVPN